MVWQVVHVGRQPGSVACSLALRHAALQLMRREMQGGRNDKLPAVREPGEYFTPWA